MKAVVAVVTRQKRKEKKKGEKNFGGAIVPQRPPFPTKPWLLFGTVEWERRTIGTNCEAERKEGLGEGGGGNDDEDDDDDDVARSMGAPALPRFSRLANPSAAGDVSSSYMQPAVACLAASDEANAQEKVAKRPLRSRTRLGFALSSVADVGPGPR